eukprot:COSAG06_NODE_3357_length_5461_cov_81.770981_6_plen_378_part_00
MNCPLIIQATTSCDSLLPRLVSAVAQASGCCLCPRDTARSAPGPPRPDGRVSSAEKARQEKVAFIRPPASPVHESNAPNAKRAQQAENTAKGVPCNRARLHSLSRRCRGPRSEPTRPATPLPLPASLGGRRRARRTVRAYMPRRRARAAQRPLRSPLLPFSPPARASGAARPPGPCGPSCRRPRTPRWGCRGTCCPGRSSRWCRADRCSTRWRGQNQRLASRLGRRAGSWGHPRGWVRSARARRGSAGRGSRCWRSRRRSCRRCCTHSPGPRSTAPWTSSPPPGNKGRSSMRGAGRGVSTARTDKRRTQGSIVMRGVLIMKQPPRHLSKCNPAGYGQDVSSPVRFQTLREFQQSQDGWAVWTHVSSATETGQGEGSG